MAEGEKVNGEEATAVKSDEDRGSVTRDEDGAASGVSTGACTHND